MFHGSPFISAGNLQHLSYAKVPPSTIDHSVGKGDSKLSTDRLHADLIQ